MSPGALLALLTAIRLVVAAATPLAADEAYYWVWSQALAPGYLDHPPMVALWIRLGTAIAGDTALGVRLLGPLAAAAGSVMLAQAAEALFPGRRLGVPAAALLNATLMVGVGAVTMTPDTPLLLFMTGALWALTRVSRDGRWWLAVGASAGLAMDSKYTAVLLGVAIPLWLLWVPSLRVQFRGVWLWAGAGVTALMVLPVVSWNASHGWASFARQGGRAGDWHPAEALRHLGELLAGQAALATPLAAVLFGAGLWQAARGARRRDPAWSLLAALGGPGLLLFVEHAVGDRVQANWVAMIYPPLALAAVAAGWRWRAAAGLGFAVTALVYVQAAAAPLPLPRRFDPTLIRLAGWHAVARDADAMRRAAGADYLAAEEYGLVSLLAWWAPAGTEVVGAEPRWDLVRLPRPGGGRGLLLISTRRREPPDPALWSEAAELGVLVRARGGVEAEAFRVYRVTLRPEAPAARLPRPGG
ncbi:MAG: glycosyltransferase family 39 protein [Acetobacteraceae bacterium]